MGENTLIILTSTFPFARGEEFLETEIPYLSKMFKRVILLPQKASGKMRPLPATVEVDLSLARPANDLRYHLNVLANGVITRNYYRELFAHTPFLMHPRVFLRVMRYIGNA
jgi:hypothetical protein